MLKIQRLKRPTKKSGYKLAPNGTTEVRGLTVVNRNKFPVWVDKFTLKKRKAKKK